MQRLVVGPGLAQNAPVCSPSRPAWRGDVWGGRRTPEAPRRAVRPRLPDLAHWCAVEEVPCVVMGVPKSIDNDFLLVGESGWDSGDYR
jgi:hypothetical protein